MRMPIKVISNKEYDNIKKDLSDLGESLEKIKKQSEKLSLVSTRKKGGGVSDGNFLNIPKEVMEKEIRKADKIAEKALFPKGINDMEQFNKEIGFKHKEDYKENDSIMKGVPVVYASIKKITNTVFSGGISVETSDKQRGKKIAEEYVDKYNLLSSAKTQFEHGLRYGNSFVELKTMKILHPFSMYVKKDNKGNVTGYTQYFKGLNVEPIKFKPSEIGHIKFNEIGENPVYGTSIIEIVRRNVNYYLQFEKDVSIVYHRKINAPIHVQVGSDEYPVMSSATLNEISNILSVLGPDEEFVTSHLVNMNTEGARGKVLDITPFVNTFRGMLNIGLMTPEFLLGLSGSNAQSAEELMKDWDVLTQAYRDEFSEQFNDKILKPTLGKKFRITWGISEAKKRDLAEHLAKFFDTKRLVPDVILQGLARKIADIYDLDIGEGEIEIPKRNPNEANRPDEE